MFTLWGGRSRTPSVDEGDMDGEQEEKQCQCKGGPGKPKCGNVVDPSKNGEAGIKCDRCSDWVHAACQLIPKAAVTAVSIVSLL